MQHLSEKTFNQEISKKRQLVRTTKQNFTPNELHCKMCFIDFENITTIFSLSNGKKKSKIHKTHGKKLHNLLCYNCYDNSDRSQDFDEMVFIFLVMF